MTVWCAGLDETGLAGLRLEYTGTPTRTTCTPNGPLYRVTYTRCRIDTINSPDDGHMATRNM